MNCEIYSKQGHRFLFRRLQHEDGEKLGSFFQQLDAATRARFGPHPLTKEHGTVLCSQIHDKTIILFVVEHNGVIVGYFILDFNEYPHEAQRYLKHNIIIDPALDPVFAPCIAPEFQNCGIATQCMTCITTVAHEMNLRRIVLMGGTQESNERARAFYQKCGFREFGHFYTEYNGENNVDMLLELVSS